MGNYIINWTARYTATHAYSRWSAHVWLS